MTGSTTTHDSLNRHLTRAQPYEHNADEHTQR